MVAGMLVDILVVVVGFVAKCRVRDAIRVERDIEE
jgi:hypothetical protein